MKDYISNSKLFLLYILLLPAGPGWPNDANDDWEWDEAQWKEIKFQILPGSF